MRRRTRFLASILLAAGMLGGNHLTAASAASTLPPDARTVTRPDGPLKVIVVLDVSGSMKRPGGLGPTLLGGAKQALAELVTSLPSDTEVGLRVYGSTYSGPDRTISCNDTKLLVPVGPVDPGRVIRAAADLKATGDTPIGLSLKRAAGDLESGAASQRVVVLISDGEDNCSPPATPPCQVAQGLQRSGVDVRVETIGVALREQTSAREALRCISGHTGGSYYDAEDTDALSAALGRIGSKTLGSLGRGKKVKGAERPNRAPLLKVGAYRVSIKPGQALWFNFRVRNGQQPRVLATVQGLRELVVPKAARNCPAWRTEIYNPFGEGGTYPPYGNTGLFDGVGYGASEASSTGPATRYNKGIDYGGVWGLQLSLAKNTIDTCSKNLPPDATFTARFSIAITGDPDESATAGPPAGPVDPSTQPSAATPSGTPAATKYNTPVAAGRPGWLYPVIAVGTLLIGAAAALIGVLTRRRRRRGW